MTPESLFASDALNYLCNIYLGFFLVNRGGRRFAWLQNIQ